MSATKDLKIEDEFKELVDGLLGAEVKVSQAQPLVPAPGDKLMLARYLDRQDRTRGVAVCDFPFIAFCGCALAMVPLEKATEALESEEPMPEEIRDNGQEILNVAAAVLNNAQSTHVRIDKVFTLPSVIDVDLVPPLVAPRFACHMQVEIPDYGMGRVSYYLR